MENVTLLKKTSIHPAEYSDSEILLKELSNKFDQLDFPEFSQHSTKMSTPSNSISRSPSIRSRSPELSETLQKHLFIQRVIPNSEKNVSPPSTESNKNRSLEEITKNIKEIEDFITVTEEILKKERERDRDFYARERHRKDKSQQINKNITENGDHGNNLAVRPCDTRIIRSPTPFRKSSLQEKSPVYKIHRSAARKIKSGSPKSFKSRLYFKNGKIGCVEAEEELRNVEKTHALVKHIIKQEFERPLVPLEHVERVLSASQEQNDLDDEGLTKTQTGPANEDRIEIVNERAVDVEFEPISVGTPVEDETLCIMEPGSVTCDKEYRKDEIDGEVIEKIFMQDNSMYQRATSSDPLQTEGDNFVKERIQHLIRRFTARARKMRNRIEMPPTPSSSASSPSPPPPQQRVHRTEDMNQKRSGNPQGKDLFEMDGQSVHCNYFICPSFCGGGKNNGVLDPQGRFYISWLFVVSLSFLYNAYVIPLRSSFPFQTETNTTTWLAIDFCADVIYLLDILFVKHRLMYLYEGFWVKDKTMTRKNYMRKLQFKMDIISLMPLDLLYLVFGTKAVVLRAPRLLKIQSFWEFFKLLDRVLSSPHIVRVAKTLTYMLFMIHLTACAYYAYSAAQGLGTNRWVFSGKGHPYVRCFAFATKTATSIGKNPKPDNEGELVFMTCAWLMGVFVFALLIGQIRDIIATATRSQSEYKQLVDETLEYMRRLNLSTDVQRRVKMWYTFTWEQQRTLDESHILDSLPANLKTDIAISVHIQTLSKVQLFADCEEALLRELVLKLRSVTFLPGDYVCRKGEVGKEMYIIKLGQVQVMGGSKNDEVLATLSEGSVFGEISLLAINGAEGNRRTADVRSKGFSNLFVLSKSDLNEAIVYYPNAQAVLKRRARSLMRRNAAREREEARRSVNSAEETDVVIANPKRPQSPPKLLQAVIKALPEQSPAVVLLTQGSKRWKKKTTPVESQEHSSQTWEDLKMIGINGGVKTLSCDLLLAIQNELKNNNSFVNLTDAEKTMMKTTGTTKQDDCQFNCGEDIKCDVVVHREMQQ